jgi:PAS domain-containing protein
MTMTDTSAARAMPAPRGRGSRQPSVAWQLALAQEFGGAFPFEWDANSGEIIASAALKALFETAADQPLLARTVAARIDPADLDRVKAETQARLEGGGRFESEFRITDADSHMRWVLARGRTLAKGPNGRIAGVGARHHAPQDGRDRARGEGSRAPGERGPLPRGAGDLHRRLHDARERA